MLGKILMLEGRELKGAKCALSSKLTHKLVANEFGDPIGLIELAV